MKRFLPLLCALFLSFAASAETTYLPTYRGYIHIVDGTDTVSVESPLTELALSDTASAFTIHINHELVDEDKVEAIKRSKRTQLVMTVTSVVSGVPGGGIFTQLGNMIKKGSAALPGNLSEIYEQNMKSDQVLSINVWIDNNSDEELLINDTDRGLIWFLPAGQGMDLRMTNPDVIVSDGITYGYFYTSFGVYPESYQRIMDSLSAEAKKHIEPVYMSAKDAEECVRKYNAWSGKGDPDIENSETASDDTTKVIIGLRLNDTEACRKLGYKTGWEKSDSRLIFSMYAKCTDREKAEKAMTVLLNSAY